MLHIALFSFMSFYHQVFSYKVFNETMLDASICLISCFFPQGFSKELKELVGLKDSIKRGSVTKPVI